MQAGNPDRQVTSGRPWLGLVGLLLALAPWATLALAGSPLQIDANPAMVGAPLPALVVSVLAIQRRNGRVLGILGAILSGLTVLTVLIAAGVTLFPVLLPGGL